MTACEGRSDDLGGMTGVMGEVGMPAQPHDTCQGDYSERPATLAPGLGVCDTPSSDPGYSTASLLPDQQLDELQEDSMHSITDSQDLDLAKQGLASAYKFKNTIKLRFSADAHTPEKGSQNYVQGDCRDSSSVSSDDSKRKGEKAQSHSPSSDSTSTQYPASDYSSNGNGSSSSSSSNCMRQGTRENENLAGSNMASQAATALNSAVPGFALHPSGTYYIPIVIAVAHLLPFLRHETGSSVGICHPVSIPISFGGPFLSMQNIEVTAGTETSSALGVVPKTEPGYSVGCRRWRNERESHQVHQ